MKNWTYLVFAFLSLALVSCGDKAAVEGTTAPATNNASVTPVESGSVTTTKVASTYKGTAIEVSGQLDGAANLQAFFDKLQINKASEIVNKTTIGADGSFKLNFDNGLAPGMYRIRVGAQKINLFLDGTEKSVAVKGALASLGNYDFDIQGSQASLDYQKVYKDLLARKLKANDIQKFVATTPNPHVAALVAMESIGNNGQFLNIHKTALNKLQTTYPTDPSVLSYRQERV